jgi:hypothetical protein
MRRITVRLGDYVEEEKRRERRGGRAVAVVALIVAGVIAMSRTSPVTPANPGTPAHLAPSSLALQFAPQLAGSASPAQLLRLRNVGGTALTIAKVTADNDAFQLQHDCATLAPNESCSAAVVFSPSAAGTQRGTLGVQTETGTTQIALEGEGRAIPAVDLGPTDFGSAPVGSAAERIVRFMNSGPSPIAIAKSSAAGPFAIAADACSGTVNPGANCEVRVQFHPAAAGSATGELLLAGANGGVIAKGSLVGSGAGTAQPLRPAHLVVSPDRLKFQQLRGTASAPMFVRLQNDGDEALPIRSISGDNGPFHVSNDCGKSIAGNASCTISATFFPTTAWAIGLHTGSIVIQTDSGRAVVQLEGEARAGPEYYLEPTDFGRAPVGRSVERAIRYVNRGAAPIAMGTAMASLPFVVSSDRCNNTIVAPGSSCEIRIRFTPSAAGSTDGELLVRDSRPDVVAKGELRGTGVREAPPQFPSIDIKPREINFHGDPGTKTIVVTNTSTVPVSLSAKPETTSRYLINAEPCNVTLAPGQQCTITIDGRFGVRIGTSARVAISYLGRTELVPVAAK